MESSEYSEGKKEEQKTGEGMEEPIRQLVTHVLRQQGRNYNP